MAGTQDEQTEINSSSNQVADIVSVKDSNANENSQRHNLDESRNNIPMNPNPSNNAADPIATRRTKSEEEEDKDELLSSHDNRESVQGNSPDQQDSKRQSQQPPSLETTHNALDDEYDDHPYPSMTFSLFLYWVFPILLLSIFGRIGVDTSIPHIPVHPKPAGGGPSKSVEITPKKLQKAYLDYEKKKKEFEIQQKQQQNMYSIHNNVEASIVKQQQQGHSHNLSRNDTRQQRATVQTPAPSTPSVLDFDASSWPDSYRSIVQTILDRRPGWHHGPSIVNDNNNKAKSSPKQQQRNKSERKTTSYQDSLTSRDLNPKQVPLYDTIQKLKQIYESDRSDIFNALAYADAMRHWGMTIFDGGSYDQTAMDVYTTVVVHLRQKRKALQQQGLATDQSDNGRRQNVASEYDLPYQQKSIDGLLCSVYTSLGKLYFMANMFERSDQVLSYCCDEIEPHYLEARTARGSTRIVLGDYSGAAEDYALVITKDDSVLFTDAYTGLVRVLEASESSVPTGWDFVVGPLQSLIQNYEAALQVQAEPNYIQAISDALRRFHHALFVYHDKKTKDYGMAWTHLVASHKFKLNALPEYPYGSETARLEQIKKVFGKGFWPEGIGSTSQTPIFIIGFARSGSTLLERVLDAHPAIAGLGENSVFNGQLESIRQRFVEASSAGGGYQLVSLAQDIAVEVVDAMTERWDLVDQNTAKDSGKDRTEVKPLRFVDKMLTNYFNIGFIQMIFPQALILHVIREPMDTLFSAFKHDFPSDRLAYTADEKALVELYRVYRETIQHWDETLPGRITHVRYEDMVQDMPGMARAIIEATGLEWDDSVLEFHKQKHYVNTYSTTQVRKQVYSDSVKSWKRYEKQLQPLADMLGQFVSYNQGTTLPTYTPPSTKDHDEL